MEALLGHNFSNVRVHEGPEAASIDALAFTRGSHLHFAPGQFRPDSAEGQRILVHELAHVIQQRAGQVRPTGGTVVPFNGDAHLEGEADSVAGRAARGEKPVITGFTSTLAMSSTAPIQRTKIKLIRNDQDDNEEIYEINDEDLLQEIFNATLDYHKQLIADDEAKGELSELKKVPREYTGRLQASNIGPRDVTSIEKAAQALIFGINNADSEHTLRFRRRVHGGPYEHTAKLEPMHGAFYVTPRGDYDVLNQKVAGINDAYTSALTGVQGAFPSGQQLTGNALTLEARRRTGRLLLALIKRDNERRNRDVFGSKIPTIGKKRVSAFDHAADVVAVATMAEAHRNALMLPLSLMAYHGIKHGKDPAKVFPLDKGSFPAAASSTQRKLQAIHDYYFYRAKGEKLPEARNADFTAAKDVHDKMKALLQEFFDTKSVKKTSLQKEGIPEITDRTSALKAAVTVVKRKFLGIEPGEALGVTNWPEEGTLDRGTAEEIPDLGDLESVGHRSDNTFDAESSYSQGYSEYSDKYSYTDFEEDEGIIRGLGDSTQRDNGQQAMEEEQPDLSKGAPKRRYLEFCRVINHALGLRLSDNYMEDISREVNWEANHDLRPAEAVFLILEKMGREDPREVELVKATLNIQE